MNLSRLVSKDELKNKLSSFYKDQLFSDEFIDNLFDIYIDAAGLLAELANNIDNCKVISDTPAYRIIPTFVLIASSGLYNIDNLKTTDFRFQGWDNLSLAQKVALLDSAGIYENLTYSQFEYNRIIASIARVEVDRFIEDKYSSKYIEFVDFALKDNKLYFFDELAKPAGTISNQSKPIILKNIAVDYGDLVHKWGIFTGIPKPPYLSYQAYREVISILLRTLVEGPRIPNLASAARAISGWEEGLVVDSYTPEIDKYGLTLGPFDFAVLLPINLVNYPDRVKYISSFMRLVKPDYTDYYTSYSGTFMEEFSRLSDDSYTLEAAVLKEEIYTSATIISVPFFLDEDFLNTEFMLDVTGGDPSFLELTLFEYVSGMYDKTKLVNKKDKWSRSYTLDKSEPATDTFFSKILGWGEEGTILRKEAV